MVCGKPRPPIPPCLPHPRTMRTTRATGETVSSDSTRTASPRRPAGAVHQPRQRGDTPALREVLDAVRALSAVLLQRASGNWLQIPSQHVRIRRSARHDRALCRRRPADRNGHLREEHHRSDQQAGLPLPLGAGCRHPLDGDGAPLQRSALAASCTDRQGRGHARGEAGRG